MKLTQTSRDSAIKSAAYRHEIASEIIFPLGDFAKKDEAEHIVYVALVISELYSHHSRWEKLGKKLNEIIKHSEKLIELLRDEDAFDFCVAVSYDEGLITKNTIFIGDIKRRIEKYKEFVGRPGRKNNKPLNIFIEQLLWAWDRTGKVIIVNRHVVSSKGIQEYYGETFDYIFLACKKVFGERNLSTETIGSLIEDYKSGQRLSSSH